jgi:hypothetical protein
VGRGARSRRAGSGLIGVASGSAARAVAVVQPQDACGPIRIAPKTSQSTITSSMAAIFNLNHHAHTVHWYFFTMSVSNVVVIVLMLVVFVLAIALPFPGTGARRGG